MKEKKFTTDFGWIENVNVDIGYNVSVLYDVADFQQKAQYEAPKLNLK
jgi:hypothetical protein